MKKVALITGASSGIGYELAKIFAREGFNLLLIARGTKKLQEIAKDFQKKYLIEVIILSKDLSKPGAADEIYEFSKKHNLEVGFLINNAGFGAQGQFIDSDFNEQLAMIQVNITALTHLTRLFLEDMVKLGRGKVLNVASTAAFLPGPLLAIYYASKAYVLSFSEALSEEVRGTGVTVTALCPGPTGTNFRERAGLKNTPLFAKDTIMKADRVAKIGYSAMMKGKSTVIAGFRNKIQVFFIKLLPRNLMAKVAKRIQTRAD